MAEEKRRSTEEELLKALEDLSVDELNAFGRKLKELANNLTPVEQSMIAAIDAAQPIEEELAAIDPDRLKRIKEGLQRRFERNRESRRLSQ